MPEVECQECFWQGDAEDLVGWRGVEKCPQCGSDDICDYEVDDDTTDD